MRNLKQRTEKRCAACKKVLPVSEFHKAGRYLQGKCKVCVVQFVGQWRRMNPEKRRENERAYKRRWMQRKSPAERAARYRKELLSSKYGITPEAYDVLHQSQNGCCAICNEKAELTGKRRLAVDHDHVTDTIRGLLCSKCNTSLERIENDPDWCTKALNYLAKHTTGKLEEIKSNG